MSPASQGGDLTRAYRVRNIPQRYDREAIKAIIETILSTETVPCRVLVRSFATHALHSQPGNHTAIFSVLSAIPSLLQAPQNEWVIKEFDTGSQEPGEALVIDSHFEGFTVLWSPEGADHEFDLVAVSGLGSHAWGSFKQRGNPSMWLADELHLRWTKARIMIYGYESTIMGTQSVQDLHDIAMTFKDRLVSIRESTKYSFKRIPIIFLGHSLGGLVIKQALVYLSRQRMPERAAFLSTYAFLFFGVPCNGLAGERVGVATMAEGQATQGFLSDIRLNSRTVMTLAQEFRAIFDPRPWVVILSFYETLKSPTAIKIDGITSITGPPELWVSRVAAFNGRNADQANDISYCIPLPTDHSGLVKCEKWDTLDLILGKFEGFDSDFAEDWIKQDWDDEAQGSINMAPGVYFPDRTKNNNEIEQEIEQSRKRGEIVEAILNSLYFPEIFVRMDQIDPAHAKTFQWLLSPSMLTDEVTGSQLLKWLNKDDPLFWISGKAGSGKSTLMKVLHDDDRMMENVRSWANGNPVVTSTFFFSQKAESQIQKSREGLLRALLYQILTERKDLIRRVFAKQFEDESWLEVQTAANHVWTWPELKQAFEKLVGGGLDHTQFFIFVDGLDEYRIDNKRDYGEHDHYGSNDASEFDQESGASARIKKIQAGHAEIAKLFRDISTFRNIKICLSSRPLNIFQDMFGNNADHLNLHEITADDIKTYVNDVLDNNQLMRSLTVQDPLQCRRLVAEVVAKAEGVFLWVRLVVDILLEVLQDRGAISDLRTRLKGLPHALGGPNGLYMSMLRDVKPELRPQGSQILRILRGTDRPISALVLHFITGDSNSTSRAEEMTAIAAEEISKWMIGRLRSCCGGLVDTKRLERVGRQTQSIDPYDMVQFMHLTVREFLDTHPPWGQSNFKSRNDIRGHLLRACLFDLKLLRLPEHRSQPEGDPERDTFSWCWEKIHQALAYAYGAEQLYGAVLVDTLDDLDATCQRIHDRIPGISRYVDGTSATTGWHWAMEDPCNSGPLGTELPMDDFFSLAIEAGLFLYIGKKLETGVMRLGNKYGRPYLDYAVNVRVTRPRFRGTSNSGGFTTAFQRPLLPESGRPLIEDTKAPPFLRTLRSRITSALEPPLMIASITPQSRDGSIQDASPSDALLFTPPLDVEKMVQSYNIATMTRTDLAPPSSIGEFVEIPAPDQRSFHYIGMHDIVGLLFRTGANPNQRWPLTLPSNFDGNTVWSRLLFNTMQTGDLIQMIKLFVAHGTSPTKLVQFEIPYRIDTEEHTYIMSLTPYDILKRRLGESLSLVASCGIAAPISSVRPPSSFTSRFGSANTFRRNFDKRESFTPPGQWIGLNQARISSERGSTNQTLTIPREEGKKSSIYKKMKKLISKKPQK